MHHSRTRALRADRLALLLVAVAAALLVLGFAESDALAWGPATHLEFGFRMLEHLHMLPPTIAHLISAHPEDYLYGNVGADVTIGKNLAAYANHAHNWSVAFRLLDQAESDRQRAFAYGFLTHLSVDVISHNYYVPRKTVRSFAHRGRGHTYWEVRMEEKVWRDDGTSFSKARRSYAFDRLTHSHNDALMSAVIPRTLFGFRVNRRIFDGMMILSELRRWRKTIGSLARRSELELAAEEVDEVLALGTRNAIGLLSKAREAPCTRADPTGARTLHVAGALRTEIRRRWKAGVITRDEGERYAHALRPRFLDGIYGKLDLPPCPGNGHSLKRA